MVVGFEGVGVFFGGDGGEFVDIGGFDHGGLGAGFWGWVRGATIFLSTFSTTFADWAFFNVPFACTSFSILLVDGVTGVGCSGAIVEWGASFFVGAAAAAAAAAFVLFATVFFSFLTSTTFSFPLAFVATFFIVVLSTSAAGVVPASSGTTFFGRPRFLTTGGSFVDPEDILAVQLARRR
jgi:hypothetical protein